MIPLRRTPQENSFIQKQSLSKPTQPKIIKYHNNQLLPLIITNHHRKSLLEKQNNKECLIYHNFISSKRKLKRKKKQLALIENVMKYEISAWESVRQTSDNEQLF